MRNQEETDENPFNQEPSQFGMDNIFQNMERSMHNTMKHMSDIFSHDFGGFGGFDDQP